MSLQRSLTKKVADSGESEKTEGNRRETIREISIDSESISLSLCQRTISYRSLLPFRFPRVGRVRHLIDGREICFRMFAEAKEGQSA